MLKSNVRATTSIEVQSTGEIKPRARASIEAQEVDDEFNKQKADVEQNTPPLNCHQVGCGRQLRTLAPSFEGEKFEKHTFWWL